MGQGRMFHERFDERVGSPGGDGERTDQELVPQERVVPQRQELARSVRATAREELGQGHREPLDLG